MGGHGGADRRTIGEQRQATGLRALDVGGSRGRVEHPLGVGVRVQRARDVRLATLTEPENGDSATARWM